jgi:AAA15 family ATPase/GTPase
MLNTIELRNFKSIKQLEIELAPLTILVGPNGSGKSSILEAIALMAQSVEGHRRLSESLRGELVNFEELRNILFKGLETSRLSFGIGADEDLENLEPILKKEFTIFERRREQAPALSKYVSRLRQLESEIGQETKHGKYLSNTDSKW